MPLASLVGFPDSFLHQDTSEAVKVYSLISIVLYLPIIVYNYSLNKKRGATEVTPPIILGHFSD